MGSPAFIQARFRGLAGTDAAAKIDWRQAKTRCRSEARRADDPPPVDHRGERRGSTGQPTRGTQGVVAFRSCLAGLG